MNVQTAAVASILGVLIALAISWPTFVVLGGSVRGNNPTEVARRWMNWIILVGIVGLYGKGFGRLFSGAGDAARIFVEGTFSIVIFAALAFVAGFAFTKIRGITTLKPVTQLQQSSVEPTQKTMSPKESVSSTGSRVISPSLDEDQIYAQIADELESGQTDKGLWTRLFAEFDGDENKVKVLYIKQRAEKLIAHALAHNAELARAAEGLARTTEEKEHKREKLRAAFAVVHRDLSEIDRRQIKRILTDITEQREKSGEPALLIELFGGDFCWEGGMFATKCSVTLFGAEHQFKNSEAFRDWIVDEVIPLVPRGVVAS